jgi:hypothetical protein
MAEQNFAAGLEMTMTSVIANYLRWFRLSHAKRALSRDPLLIRSGSPFPSMLQPKRQSPTQSLQAELEIAQDPLNPFGVSTKNDRDPLQIVQAEGAEFENP